MTLAERVPAGDERDGFLIVHRHARERLPDIPRRGERIRLAIRTFRIDVDQTHLHGGERLLKLAIAVVAFVSEPFAFRSPIDILLGFPHVFAATTETEGLESHRFERDVAGEDDQVGPMRFSVHTFA